LEVAPGWPHLGRVGVIEESRVSVVAEVDQGLKPTEIVKAGPGLGLPIVEHEPLVKRVLVIE
jgi:hypothetical protein